MMTEAPAETPEALLTERASAEFAAAVSGAWRAYGSLRLHVVLVRDWFGPNWLGFKGKVIGALGTWSDIDRRLVVPPFVPNRIDQASWFERDTADSPWRSTVAAPLNITIRGEANTRRYFDQVAGSRTMAAWIGDDGRGRASLMTYAIMDDQPIAWYASTEAIGQRGSRLVGIGDDEFEMLQRGML